MPGSRVAVWNMKKSVAKRRYHRILRVTFHSIDLFQKNYTVNYSYSPLELLLKHIFDYSKETIVVLIFTYLCSEHRESKYRDIDYQKCDKYIQGISSINKVPSYVSLLLDLPEY